MTSEQIYKPRGVERLPIIGLYPYFNRVEAMPSDPAFNRYVTYQYHAAMGIIVGTPLSIAIALILSETLLK